MQQKSNTPAAPQDVAQWAQFVQLVAGGASPEEAAAELDYPEPRQAAAAMMANPDIRKALVTATEARLLSEAAPLAMGVMLGVLKDPTCPASVRGKMAIAVYDRATKSQAEDAKRPNRLEDLTIEELARLVGQLRGGEGLIDVTPP